MTAFLIVAITLTASTILLGAGYITYTAFMDGEPGRAIIATAILFVLIVMYALGMAGLVEVA